ncbi:MBL fold metallo-hydrolase [Massilia sp. Leaf139]|uniref:MBL fold metallo-hydrolase n=1 Tax=Massilia sp. Leaf139 TaxID=1736272 RepID=UPI0009EAE978|nr:MBL fold metallo-hydrolase [Massilia sp. Leaf139]
MTLVPTLDTAAARIPSGAAGLGFQLIRNATVKLRFGTTTFLVDPMLAKKDSFPGFPGTMNSHLRNPTVELPLRVAEIVQADAVILTHIHPDHWDASAKAALPKDIPMFVQNEDDAAGIRRDGFTDVRVLGADSAFRGVRLHPVTGQHGSETHMAMLGSFLGETVGVVLRGEGDEGDEGKTVYIAGDTVWTPEVDRAIATWQPDIIVLNTGYARIEGFDGAIIMGKEDLKRAHDAAPGATVIGIHMEAFNHMMQSRRELLDYVRDTGMDAARVLVPDDGQAYRF